MQVTYIDFGVQYAANNNTLTFTGDNEYGEVHYNGEFMGTYEQNEDTCTIFDMGHNDIAQFENTEDGYEWYAKRVL